MRNIWIVTFAAALIGTTSASASSTRKLYGAQVINGSGVLTLPSSTDTLVGRATADALTNKDIDGGTASNSNRVTLPKNTTANLSGLTRKQGNLFYDTSLNQVVFDTGSVLTALATSGGGAPAIWSGYHSIDCDWTSGVSAFADPSADASCTAVELVNSGMGTVTSTSSLGGSASRTPLITITSPPRTAYYRVTANGVFHISGGGYVQVRLVDSSGNELAGGVHQPNAASIPFHLVGFLNATASVSIGAKIQIAVVTSGTGHVGDSVTSYQTGDRAISWTVEEIR